MFETTYLHASVVILYCESKNIKIHSLMRVDYCTSRDDDDLLVVIANERYKTYD